MVPLDHAECLRLLGRGVIGRVIHTGLAAAGERWIPAVRPMQHRPAA
jgi:hypothetical protein